MTTRRLPIRRPVLLMLAVAGVGVAAEPASPNEVFKQYTKALAAGDTEAAKAFVLADAKRMTLIDNRRLGAAAESQFRAAVEKAFPGALKPIGYGPATTRPVTDSMPDPDKVTYANDTATLTLQTELEPVRLKKVDGQWKVDLNAMYPPETVEQIETFRNALIEVMNALSAEIPTGRFKTFAEVQADLETRIKMRIATPDLPVTTRPAP